MSNPPYGVTYFHHSTNRYSDGRLVVDFLATALSLPFLPPYLNHTSNFSNGVNFAVAGSTAIDHEFFVKNHLTLDITPQSLNTELQWFENYLEARGCRRRGSKKCNEVMEDALFWVGEIGVNDYAYSLGSTLKHEVIRDLAIDNVFRFLQALLNKGAKNIVVQGHPPAGCLPLSMILAATNDRDDIGCSAIINNISHTHNSLLQAKLQQLRRRYPNALISYADYYNAHRSIMANPVAHGITEPFKVCCGSGGEPYNFDPFTTCGSPGATKACSNPATYVNWDGVHLTEAVYKIIADKFFHRGYCRPSFDVFLRNKEQEE